MKKPSDHITNKVLNNMATQQEAKLVAEWFATKKGQIHLDKIISEDFYAKEKKNHPVKNRKYIKTISAIAAILCLFLSLKYINSKVNLFGKPINITVTTAKGEKTQLVFQDGTQVFLNPDSKITFPKKFGLFSRKIQLNGDAYFKVAKNPNYPFIVQLKNTSIKVLGTSFRVKSYDNENQIDIILDKGHIAFIDKTNKKEQLTPGEQLKYNRKNGKTSIFKQFQKTNHHKNEIITLHRDKLKTILNTLKHWYHIDFVVKDSVAYNFTYTTSFNNTSLKNILLEIQKVSPVEFYQKKDTVFVRVKKGN